MPLCVTCSENPFQKSHILPNPAQINQLCDSIRSNSFPPETSSFRSFIAEAPAELARYNEEIQRLQEALDALRSERSILESYADGCRSAFSPVRRLPTELLVDIFDMCAPPGADTVSDETTPQEELERLAKTYLLRPSQVCSRWHDVIMDTAMLWSTVVVDTTCWDKCPVSSDTLLRLVVLSLERGVDVPLTLDIAVEDDSNERPLLQLITRDARRWKSIYLWIHPTSLRFLAGARGNMPVLEKLHLHAHCEGQLEADIFETLTGRSTRLPTLPWGQLLDVAFENCDSDQLSIGFDMLPLISNVIQYSLTVDISSVILPLVLKPVTSGISALTITLHASSSRTDTDSVVGAMLGCLTLPRLRKFRVFRPYDELPFLWNQPHFLSFASRSSMCASLTVLDIEAVIQHDELLQCLELITSLEALYISDCEDYETGHVLITDILLHRLVWRPDDDKSLVPRLTFLSLISLIQFRDDSLWEFLTSRQTSRPYKKGPFEIHVQWLPGREHDFSSQFIGQMMDSEKEGELLVTLRAFS
ncbi:hypothetical protein FB451DRAFT_197274 [Mycena latifolia]|nr:hypothetical protein FB451DRAFT_197274 [Mycena latifolia]